MTSTTGPHSSRTTSQLSPVGLVRATEGARRQGAFTLIELVLVMGLLALGALMAAPSLGSFLRASTLEHASRRFVALARWARAQAISEARTYRLQVEPADGLYYLMRQEGLTFVNLGNDHGRPFQLLDATLSLESSGAGATATSLSTSPSLLTAARPMNLLPVPNAIEFYPDGTSTPGTIVLQGLNGEVIRIAALSASEELRVLETEEDRR